MKILFITDIHENILLFESLDKFKSLKPDIIILGGDFSCGTTLELLNTEI